MKRQRSQALLLRQHELLLRSRVLRAEFSELGGAWRKPFVVADQVRGAWHWLRANPALPVAAAVVLTVVLAVVRPRRAWRLGLRLWWGWTSWRRLQQRLASGR